MNSFVVLFIVCAASVGVLASPKGGGHGGGHGGGKHHEIMETCMNENGVDKEEFKNSFKSGEEPEEKIKCVSHCMGKKMGMVNADDSINKEKIKNHVRPGTPEDKREEVMKKNEECANITGETACDTTFKIMKCVHPKRHHRGQHE